VGSVADEIAWSGLGPEALLQQWRQVLHDPALRRLPYRIETNKWGHVEMTPPASPRHMETATAVVDALRELLGGKAFTECAIVTPGGVKVADVVWCSTQFLEQHRGVLQAWEAALPKAPDLCIEIMSPANTPAEMDEKAALYLAAGAREAWVLGSDLTVRIYGAEGDRPASVLGIPAEALVSRVRDSLL
jgi:Uma2 family endonuclease